jgi:hypothetical protein
MGGEVCAHTPYIDQTRLEREKMGAALKAIVGFAVFAVIGLTVYGYSVNMAPLPSPQSQSVVLNGG